uniref:MIF4G domain-containing protein n=1 Tax=Trypanosoma congolense (strain IL3000) TaxID=1068625 RepID=G0UTS4_TRYCI|nr:conserved hypothetical protein [Trypanosoma congolense IL3000]
MKISSSDGNGVRKFRRTFSLVARRDWPLYRRSVPDALVEVLNGPQKRLGRFNSASIGNTARVVQCSVLEGYKNTQTNTGSSGRLDEGDIEKSYALPVNGVPMSNKGSSSTRPPEVPTQESEQNHQPNVVSGANPVSSERVSDCIPFDPEATPQFMQILRHTNDRCPPKIAAFLKEFAAHIAVNRINTSCAAPSVPSARQHGTNSGVRGGKSLGELTELWEDRLDAPIVVCSTLGRKRGLFGDVAPKELHNHVMSILNRVTEEAEKYREVKNELLRLPIPEASDEMLNKIVHVFFVKAVREHKFASLYADLVVELCKVPEGQRIGGNKTQSLEFRMRQQLLSLCQAEFRLLEEQNIENARLGGEDRSTQNSDEDFRQRRDRACGIVVFVGQLFLRHVVTEKVIMEIIVSVSTGCYGRDGFVIPPPYTPSEGQMDELIKLLSIGDTDFFSTATGSPILLPFTDVMRHWSPHHPVTRVQLLLLSVIDRLQKIIEEHQSTPQGSQQHPHRESAFEGKSPPNSVSEARLPVSPLNDGNSQLSTPAQHSMVTVLSAEAVAKVSPPPVYVGGTPIPAPRSAASRQGSVTLSTPLTSTGSASSVRQVATAESVANCMQNLTRGLRRVDGVAEDIINTFDDVTSVVSMWTERCLTVVKTAKERSLYGPFLCSIDRQYRGTLRDKLREVAKDAFRCAVRQHLYEDLSIFRYWAEMILSDTTRTVLNEELLNDGLRLVIDFGKVPVRMYLCDVAIELQRHPTEYTRQPSIEDTGFVRFRPLQTLYQIFPEGRGGLLQMIDCADVRKWSVEIDVFCSLLSPTLEKSTLFASLRSSSYMNSPSFVAEILSAVLHAASYSNGKVIIDDHMDLFLLAVDGRDRPTREILLVMELYAVLKYSVPPTSQLNITGEFVMARFRGSIVTDQTRVRAHKYLEATDKLGHHFIGFQPPHATRYVESNSFAINNTHGKGKRANNGSTGGGRKVYPIDR